MPLYSSDLYASPSSSAYSGLYLPGAYNHSSLLSGALSSSYRAPVVSKAITRFPRAYKPHLGTISEAAVISPIRKFNPGLLLQHHSSPAYKAQKPIKINTADIDVSFNKYRKYDRKTPVMATSTTTDRDRDRDRERIERDIKKSPEKLKSPSPPSTSMGGSSSTAPKPTTDDDSGEFKPIRRDRALVRLHTVHKKDSPRKATQEKNGVGWRQNFYEEMKPGERGPKPKKSPGEILVDKFLIRTEEEEKRLQQEGRRLPRRSSARKPSFHDICRVISSDSINEDLNPGQPEEIVRRQSKHSEDLFKQIRRNSAEILKENVEILEDMLRQEHLLEDENNNMGGTEVEKPRRKKATKKKSNEKLVLDAEMDNKSGLQRRGTVKKYRRTSTDSSILSDCSQHDEEMEKAFQVAIRDISQVEVEEIRAKPKTKITATVDIVESPTWKAVIDNVEIVESPTYKKPAKKFKYNVTVEEVDDTPVVPPGNNKHLPQMKLDLSGSALAMKRERSKSPQPPAEATPSTPGTPSEEKKLDLRKLSQPGAVFNLRMHGNQMGKISEDENIEKSPPQSVKVEPTASTLAPKTLEVKKPLGGKLALASKEENRSGENFWEKIGTRESVNFDQRRKNLQEKRLAVLIKEEDEEQDANNNTTGDPIWARKFEPKPKAAESKPKIDDKVVPPPQIEEKVKVPSKEESSKIVPKVAPKVEAKLPEIKIKDEVKPKVEESKKIEAKPKTDEKPSTAKLEEKSKLCEVTNKIEEKQKAIKELQAKVNGFAKPESKIEEKPKLADEKLKPKLSTTVLEEKVEKPKLIEKSKAVEEPVKKNEPKIPKSVDVGSPKPVVTLKKVEDKVTPTPSAKIPEKKTESASDVESVKPKLVKDVKDSKVKEQSVEKRSEVPVPIKPVVGNVIKDVKQNGEMGKIESPKSPKSPKTKVEEKPKTPEVKVKEKEKEKEKEIEKEKQKEKAKVEEKIKIPEVKPKIEEKSKIPQVKTKVEEKAKIPEVKGKVEEEPKVPEKKEKEKVKPPMIKDKSLEKPTMVSKLEVKAKSEEKPTPGPVTGPIEDKEQVKPKPKLTKDKSHEAPTTPTAKAKPKNKFEASTPEKPAAPEPPPKQESVKPPKKIISKRSLVNKSGVADPDLEVFQPPSPPARSPSPPKFVPLQSNRISQFMNQYLRRNEFDEKGAKILYARPKTIRHRHYPRPRISVKPQQEGEEAASDEESDEEEEEEEDESTTMTNTSASTPTATSKQEQSVSSASSSDEEEDGDDDEDSDDDDDDDDEEDDSEEGEDDFDYEAMNDVWGYGSKGASTSSGDSGFHSGNKGGRRKDCDVNCHKKCEKLTANLCGINQKMIVDLIEDVKKGCGERDPPTSTPARNPALALDAADLAEEFSHSSTFSGWKRSGRITPPATTIPKFCKYNVDDFNFLKVLGKGSFGKVLLAELKNSEYYYAIKCLKKDVVLEDDDVECTLIERKVLALGTKHPYLCHLLCTFQTDSHLFFVMEYLNGGDLMFHIQQSGRFQEPRARFYAAEIMSGLKFLHGKGIVYRDLKLDNILLDFDGHVRIADFGMCKLQIFLDRMADTFCGTPDYMAPEIIKGQHYNQNVDWWSFGVLLYEMLIGQSPFSGCDEDELFWSICNERPVLPRFLSQECISILTLLLEKDATKRLGNKYCEQGDIQDQPFFRPIDWEMLGMRQLEPPFKPNLQHPLDTQYFDRTFTAERAKLTPIDANILASMDQAQFQGFSYTNPNATDR